MPAADHILACLKIVEVERAARVTVAGLDAKVLAIKTYQQRRFCHTYADILGGVRYGSASRFFLDELYGPTDFTRRDAQFARVVPALVRLFPKEIVGTVATLAELHALSEHMDTLIARELERTPVTATCYIAAWQAAGHEAERQKQIDLTIDVARSLDRLTRKPLLRNSLRLMRRPATAAGLGELQQFLERGFDTFKAMNGASEFIALVEGRERALVTALFSTAAGQTATRKGMNAAVELIP